MATVLIHDRTSPELLDAQQEFQTLARDKEAGARARRRRPGRRLPNSARMARLHAIADNPYLRNAFGDKSTLEMMRVCSENLMANQDFKAAGQLLNQIARHENLRAAAGVQPVPEPEEEPAGPEPGQLDLALPEPVDPPPPRLSAMETFIAGLNDRELAAFLRTKEREDADPPEGPGLYDRLRPFLEARGLHDPDRWDPTD